MKRRYQVTIALEIEVSELEGAATAADPAKRRSRLDGYWEWLGEHSGDLDIDAIPLGGGLFDLELDDV